MRLETDDNIHRFQGRWVARRGARMPVAARYTAWGVYAAAIIPMIILGRVTRLPFGFFLCFVFGGSALIAKFVADYLNGEYSLSAWVGLFTCNLTAWRRHRRHRRAELRRGYRIHHYERR